MPKVTYIITQTQLETPESWKVQTNEEMLVEIKKTIMEEPYYVIDGLNNFTIEVKLEAE